MHWRLILSPSPPLAPEMYVCLLYFIHALGLGIHSLRPHPLLFRGFPFHLSDHQSGKSQWGGSAVQCISLPSGERAPLRPHELEQATKHFWPGAREVIPAPGKKKKKKAQRLWACGSPSLCWADSYSSIDIESQENCSLPRPAKNIQIHIYNARCW